ncbi:hypothetical protein ES708_04062 [subsurface metagenome]
MKKKEVIIAKPERNFKKKLKKSFLKQNEGKWVIILKDKSVYTDKSLENLFNKYKTEIVESFRVPSKDMVMFL